MNNFQLNPENFYFGFSYLKKWLKNIWLADRQTTIKEKQVALVWQDFMI
jgi:hypothetical protein